MAVFRAFLTFHVFASLLRVGNALGHLAAGNLRQRHGFPFHGSPGPVLFQTSTRTHSKSRWNHTGSTPDGESLLADEAYLEVEDPNMEVCGTRPLVPQLQFALEVYGELGLLKMPYVRCRVPTIKSLLAYTEIDTSSVYLQFTDIMGGEPLLNENGRTTTARALIAIWATLTLYTLSSFAWSIVKAPTPGKAKRAFEGTTSESQSETSWWFLRWVSLSWLDPIIGRYGRLDSPPKVDQEELNNTGPDLQFEPHQAFSKAWQNEVDLKGLEKADLTNVLWQFLGTKTILWMLLVAGASAILDYVAMTMVLDVLVNYLHWANDVLEHLPHLRHMDILSPGLMVIGLGFVTPLVARACSVLLNLSDGYQCNRIVAGLLAVSYAKCQRLSRGKESANEGDHKENDADADMTHLMHNDVVKVWSGVLKSYANSIVAPVCSAVLVSLLIGKFGWSAVLGVVVTAWICFSCLPIMELSKRSNLRWLSEADSRVGLVRNTLCNIQAVKAAAREKVMAEQIITLREKELQAQFRFSLAQSLLSVPFSAFPYALIASTLSFHYTIKGTVAVKDIFICMQILSGLMACFASLTVSAQRIMNLPNSIRRVERFLKRPEDPVVRAPPRIAQSTANTNTKTNAVHVRGNFTFEQGQKAVLHDIDFAATQGELVAIVGETASGKSALLSTMLGQLSGTDDSAIVNVPKEIAYCAQTPWVIDGTVGENVTLGAPMDRTRFRSAIAAAALPDETTLESSRRGQVSAGDEHSDSGSGFPYFTLWNLFAFVCLVLSVMNVRWDRTHPVLGALVVGIQGVLHWSVLEIPLQAIATLFTPNRRKLARADASHLSLVLNYNLLAVTQADIDECMQNMYQAYVDNLDDRVCAVLVSATNEPHLQQYELQVRDMYRERLFRMLRAEGLSWAGLENGPVDPQRQKRIWSKYAHLERSEFASVHLEDICSKYASDFMVLHRVSRVLRKCGQYQDLMLLSAGEDRAFTYCDTALYGTAARTLNEPLFKASADADKVKGRKFDYTLVLDSDTRVEAGTAFELLEVAAAYPHRSLIQPAIKMDCGPGDSIYMHLEAMRQSINEPMNNTITNILGQSGFYGKGLVKNSAYIARCLGSREKLVESVPIDVLSHDTFEAAVLRPMYCGDVQLLEAPCHNYVTWDIRERRWNRGELLLAGYFFPSLVGAPMRWLQGLFQGRTFNLTRVRTLCKFNYVSSYIAHAALRQIVLKPLLVSYIIMVDFVEMYFEWLPILMVMFLIIVFPKIAICSFSNFRGVFLETTASILQFTPESVVGTIRVLRALKAHLTGNARWVPQRAVEEEFKQSNPFIFSLRYLWYYMVFSVSCGLLVVSLIPEGIFIMTMLGTLFALPLYAGFTALETARAPQPSPGTVSSTASAGGGAAIYFSMWNLAALVCLVLSVLNVEWDTTQPILGVIVVLIQGMLHWSVLEIPLQTIATFFTPRRALPRADSTDLKLVLNYNLLAVSQADVDECMQNMYQAYMGNLKFGVSAVLVSATNDVHLQEYELHVRDEYRERIFNELRAEGLIWAGLENGPIDVGRQERIWSNFEHMDGREFAQFHLNDICQKLAREFMVLHRVSRVLRKCGQYQDLMLLSSGEDRAFTYCDKSLYGSAARALNEPLFKPSDDVNNVNGRNFDYTLVLDSDTRVEAESAFEMLDIAAAHPDRAIVQPSIKMDVGAGDSIFMHVEAMRQSVYEPMNSTITAILGESGFYGKGLIKNSEYISKCLGTRTGLIERVPIDVLSHDTFEAAVLRPLFVAEAYLLEAPCHNYVTWDIRERRWNRGELLLAMYFFPSLVGMPVRWLQGKLQGKTFNPTRVRTVSTLDKVSSYLAHSALRQIALKPLLVSYIILVDFVEMHYEWLPILTVMFLIVVFPKFAICNVSNFRAVFLETTASILQFTPESVVGTIRVLRAVKAHLTGNARWVPQRAVEEEFKQSNPITFSLRYLWYYMVFAAACGFLVVSLIPEAIFIMTMLGTLFSLPLYAGFTALAASSVQTAAQAEMPLTPHGHASLKRRAMMAEKKLSKTKTIDELVLQRSVCTRHLGLVGQKGARLEPGQLALARAAYDRHAELVLLDDPLACVDDAASSHIMQNLLRGPLFEGKTRIVVMSPSSPHLKHFDRVVILSGGRIQTQGAPAEVLETTEFKQLAPVPSKSTDTAPEDRMTTAPSQESKGSSLECSLLETMDPQDSCGEALWTAVEAGGWHRLIASLATVALLRIAMQTPLLVLGQWADQKQAGLISDDRRHVKVMVVLILSMSVLQVAQSYLTLAFNCASSGALFRQVLNSVLRAPLDSFWNVQPAGRVINRLSGDMLTFDLTLSSGFSTLVSFAFSVLVQQWYCMSVVPWWILVPSNGAIALFAVMFWCTSKPMQNMVAIAMSTCQEEQAKALRSGPSPHVCSYLSRQLQQYSSHASAIVKPTFLTVACAKQWLILRVTLCLCFQLTACVLFGISRPSVIGIGTLAIIVASTFNIMQELDRAVDTMLNGITMAVTLQRMDEYLGAPHEQSLISSGPNQRSSGTEVRGLIDPEVKLGLLTVGGVRVHVEGLRAGYGDGENVLHGVGLDIPARARVALLGPAGSGKTTALLCLVRVLEARQGQVLLSGVDARRIELDTLRLAVGYVPQVPAIFKGTIRFNLDPLGKLSDERLWDALRCVKLLSAVQGLRGGLDHVLSTDGGSLSLGQRQLLCLAHALCRQPALLLLDDCISAVDPATQLLVWEGVAAKLPQTTIIAASRFVSNPHRFDFVVHLDKGVDVQSPRN